MKSMIHYLKYIPFYELCSGCVKLMRNYKLRIFDSKSKFILILYTDTSV